MHSELYIYIYMIKLKYVQDIHMLAIYFSKAVGCKQNM